MRKNFTCLTIAAGLLFGALPALGWDPMLKSDSFLLSNEWRAEVIGVHRFHKIEHQQSLIELGRQFRIGFNALRNANPETDPWLPLEGEVVLLPYSMILPPEAGPGITINLAEMRLYNLWEEGGQGRVKCYPIGIGTEGSETPEGQFTILNKVQGPTWVVPSSIRRERPELEPQLPPGPENPLGGYWLGLSAKGYGIHGTSEPLGVGRRVSHGCLRLYPEDIVDLFDRVEIGTPVRIIYRPIKVGVRNSTLFIESHRDYQGKIPNRHAEVVRQARSLKWDGLLDWPSIMRALEENRGIPVPISLKE